MGRSVKQPTEHQHATGNSTWRCTLKKKDTEIRYQTLSDMVADAVVLVETEGLTIIEANRAASHLTGYEPGELVGMATPGLHAEGAERRDYCDSFKRWVFDGKGYIHNGRIMKKQGGRVEVDISARAMDTGGGNKVVMEVWRDNTERNCLEKSLRKQIKVLEKRVRERTAELEEASRQLRESQQKMIQSAKLISLGEMGAGIAHELNSPLAGILGIVEVLLGRMSRDDRNYELLEKIKDAAVRSKYIILDMLSYARPFKDEREDVDMNEVIRSTLSLFVSEINVTSIEICLNLASTLPQVSGVRGQLMEVMFNIIKNARDALGGYGSITIGTSSRTDDDGKTMVVVEIRDTGPGIEPDVLERIFDPFFSTKEKGRGHNVGLGLSISRSIIAEHGGRIEAANLESGGVCFRVLLPAL